VRSVSGSGTRIFLAIIAAHLYVFFVSAQRSVGQSFKVNRESRSGKEPSKSAAEKVRAKRVRESE